MSDNTVSTVPWWALATLLLMTLINDTLAQATEPEARTPSEVVNNIVVRKARELAQKDFQKPAQVPQALAEMNYQQYRSIRFRPEASIWRGESLFELQLFHTGFLYREPVYINITDNNGHHNRLPFDPSLFRYDGPAAGFADKVPEDSGYAGFRVHFPLNKADYADEVVVFQGATYFRLVGPGQVYGISARGIAVNTAEPEGEEFPSFREFWLLKPEQETNRLTIFALMDSPSLTGAFRFVLAPGAATVVDVKAHLFARKDVKKLGLAPLTSMFMYGENRTRFYDDFRPEIHDSDGLLMQTSNNEWIWRPLVNPPSLHVSSLQDTNPRGFGLLQRDRNFDNYEDTEAHYHRRPSLWVEPMEDWGEGRVELVEIPTDSEVNDNIVAYWVPKDQLESGEELALSYRLRTFGAHPDGHNLAAVESTRIGTGAVPGTRNDDDGRERQFVVDFAGGDLVNLPADLPLKAQLGLSSGQYRDLTTERLPDGKRWRVAFKVTPEENRPVDMRMYISLRGERLSEVWNYVWQPAAVQ